MYGVERDVQYLPDGRLKLVRLSWMEPITERHELQQKLFYWSFFIVIIAGPLFFCWYTGRVKGRVDFISFVALALTPAALCMMVLVFLPPMSWFVTAWRGLALDSNCYIHTFSRPGMLGYKRQYWVERNERAFGIVSIEMRPCKTRSGGHFKHDRHHDGFFAYTVDIYFQNGDSLCVAETLSEDKARYVTAQLNDAFRKIYPHFF